MEFIKKLWVFIFSSPHVPFRNCILLKWHALDSGDPVAFEEPLLQTVAVRVSCICEASALLAVL